MGSAQYYDAIAAHYDQQMDATPATRWVRGAFRQLVTETVASGSLLLDFGCGTGVDSVWLAARGYRVIAHDSSAGMIAQLRLKGHDAVASGKVLPSHGSLFELRAELARHPPLDAVISNFAVLNLIEKPALVFAELAPHVRSAGHLIVSVQNPIFWKDLKTRVVWLAWLRSLGRDAIHIRGRDTELYRHWVSALRRMARPQFTLIRRAGVSALIRRERGQRDWNRPRSTAERFETRTWRNFPMTHIGQFLFLVFRREA
jgi:SAM-dependent methyltransferase